MQYYPHALTFSLSLLLKYTDYLSKLVDISNLDWKSILSSDVSLDSTWMEEQSVNDSFLLNNTLLAYPLTKSNLILSYKVWASA